MRFARNTSYDAEFAQVPGVRWYPFVGGDFGSGGRRVMVFAHNIPIPPADYEAKLVEWADPATWADAVEEYTYVRGWWTEAFRYFIKGAAGLGENYDGNSPAPVLARVDAFVRGIAYLNFIQDLVKSEGQIANPTWEQVCVSRRINRDLLRILHITHCICWGGPTYNYVRGIEGFRVVSEQREPRRGFASCVVETGFGHAMRLLKVFHPSMPGFGPYSEVTQAIIREFLSRAAVCDDASEIAHATS